MSDAQMAGGFDRLPWLADEKRVPAANRKSRTLTGWAAVSVMLVAGASFWLGTRTPLDQAPPVRGLTETVTVPTARPAPQPEVRIAPQREIETAPVPQVRQPARREVRIAPPPRSIVPANAMNAAAPSVSPVREVVAKTGAKSPVAKSANADALTPWPSRVTTGASGRLVQIGAYGSRIQAKRGWVAMVRAYPAVAHLSAVVVETRNSKRRAFYRFQIGTTSQAHSEVLCQRMEKIDLSCAVVGLPWKAKVER